MLINEMRQKIDVSPIAFVKKNYEFKKIRDREHEPMFKMLLGLMFFEISVFCGIKNQITDENKRDIIKMILSVYNDLTVEEIYKAFELERYGTY